MRILRLFSVSAVLAVLLVAALLAWRGTSDFLPTYRVAVKGVPPGHQELAWLSPATSSDNWERLVAALGYLQKEWTELHGKPALTLDLSEAFPLLTAEVPSIGLSLVDNPGAVLWIRWYKLSGDNDSQAWVRLLQARDTPPLAVIGGDVTDRALAAARTLRNGVRDWHGAPPLLLITNATADGYPPSDSPNDTTPQEKWPRLMDVYPDRSFRFCFPNRRILDAVMEFVLQQPQVSPTINSDPARLAGILTPDIWSVVGTLAANGYFQPLYLTSVAWWDDGYSKDLSQSFAERFTKIVKPPPGEDRNCTSLIIAHGVGDFFQANAREEFAVELYLDSLTHLTEHRHYLVLPTNAQRARRFLHDLCRRAPSESQIVVLSGDSISFNNVYRDRNLSWNILDLPVPLVFFSHRNPVDKKSGFDVKTDSVSGTNDLLLERDIVEAVLLAAFERGKLLASASDLLPRLRATAWSKGRVHNSMSEAEAGKPLFEPNGDRAVGTGEHIVWLKPVAEPVRTADRALLSIWRPDPDDPARWHLVDAPLEVRYGGGADHGH